MFCLLIHTNLSAKFQRNYLNSIFFIFKSEISNFLYFRILQNVRFANRNIWLLPMYLCMYTNVALYTIVLDVARRRTNERTDALVLSIEWKKKYIFQWCFPPVSRNKKINKKKNWIKIFGWIQTNCGTSFVRRGAYQMKFVIIVGRISDKSRAK